MKEKDNKRVHLVNLFKWRSIIALVACLVTFVLSEGSLIYGIVSNTEGTSNTDFEWFTVDSNLFMVFAIMMIIPFAIVGIQKKRLTYPKWALLIHYAGVINTTMVLVFVLCFISWYDPVLAFGNENIFLHIICPLLVLISFFMVESIYPLDNKDTIKAMIPFGIYAIMYFFNVVVFKSWEDHYMLNTFLPFYISMPLVILLVYCIGWRIRTIHNRLLKKRDNEMKLIWNENLDPVSIKIEIYSLGYRSGLNQNKESLTVPYDILDDLSERFDISLEELSRAYNKGAIVGLKEKEEKKNN